MAESPIKRSFFEFKAPPGRMLMDPDGDLDITSGDDSVSIAVSQEKAVDSGCATFTCEAVLPRADAERLRDWLTEILS